MLLSITVLEQAVKPDEGAISDRSAFVPTIRHGPKTVDNRRDARYYMIMEGRLVKTTWFLSVLAVLLLTSCTSVRLGLDYDTSTDFSTFRTFAWFPDSQRKDDDTNLKNPLMDARIRTAIEDTLSSRGYGKVPLESADFLVGYHLSIEKKLDVNTMNATFGYGRYGRGGSVGFQTSVSEYDEGTIIIDIADSETEILVWRGSGSRRIGESRDPDTMTEKVNRAVSEILSQFPPK